MADNVDPKLAAAILKHGPPTGAVPRYRLKPHHRPGFKNAEWACKHLVEKLGTPNLYFYSCHIDGELMAVCAECRSTLKDANLIIPEK